jgi:diguanylate cyclase (GGDEF)-like protein
LSGLFSLLFFCDFYPGYRFFRRVVVGNIQLRYTASMMLNRIKSLITQILQLHHEFGDRLVRITFGRLCLLSVIMLVLTAAGLVISSSLSFETDTEQQWQRALILISCITFLPFSVLCWWARPSLKLSVLVQKRITRFAHALLLVAGLGLTSIDQMVTPAVTPFLMACTVASVLIIVNPLTALIIYSALLGIYAGAMTLTQNDPIFLISNLFNGLMACCMSVGFSWILWQQNISALQQQDVIFQQQQELELSNRQLELLATRDDLTGLANRRMLQMLAAEEQTLMVRQKTPACLLLLDLDLFKNINDKLGHPAGDELLRQLGSLLTQTVRASDRVARWGGEEFAILLRHSDANQALQVAENIRTFIEQHRFELLDHSGVPHEIAMTLSIGVAQLDAKAVDTLDHAYRAADQALYAAKAAGRNRVALHASAA